jgi:hypothetical protein
MLPVTASSLLTMSILGSHGYTKTRTDGDEVANTVGLCPFVEIEGFEERVSLVLVHDRTEYSQMSFQTGLSGS